MFSLLRTFVRAFWSAFTSRRDLALRNIALEHQLDVALRPARPRRRLKLTDRILWVWLSRVWSGWRESIQIVRPETVIAWHRRGWQLYWTWRSKRRGPGRPPVPQDVRDLIRKMSSENPWGAPRLHGELLKLGIDVSQATVAKYMVRHDKPPSLRRAAAQKIPQAGERPLRLPSDADLPIASAPSLRGRRPSGQHALKSAAGSVGCAGREEP